MSKPEKLTNQQFVEAVANLCKAGESGTVFIVTGRNHQAKIILRQGEIIAAFLRPLSGLDAISALSREPELSLAFNSGLLMDVDAQILPETSSLVNYLRSGAASQAEIVSSSGDTQDFALTRVRQVMVEEAMEYLGPIAGPICDEYLQQYSSALSLDDIHRVIGQFQKDINDTNKAVKFSTAVRARLQ